MIKELRVEQWKSFDQATLYIDPLTIVIGTNASGKSNLVEALSFLHRIASGIDVDQAIKGNDALFPLRGGAEWICRRPSLEFTLAVLIGVSERQDLRYRIRVRVEGVKTETVDEELTEIEYASDAEAAVEKPLILRQSTTAGVTAREAGIPVGGYAIHAGSARPATQLVILGRVSSILPQVDGLVREEDAVDAAKLVAQHLNQIFVYDPIPSRMRDYSALSERLMADGANLAGVLAALDPQRHAEVEQTLTRYLKNLPERDIKRVWTERVGRLSTDAMLYCEEGWEGAASHEIDARGMSDGTLRYLAIVTAMLIRPPGSLLVIEDVDNGLHPSRAGLVIEMLRTLGKERGIDVIVTTHNPALLDAAGVRMLPFITVAHRDGITGASRLTQLEDIAQLPKLMAGGSLGQLATAGRIEAALEADGM